MAKYSKAMTMSGNAGKVSSVKFDDKGRRVGQRNGKPIVLITPNDIAVILGLDAKSGGKRVRGLLRGVEVGNDKVYTRWSFDATSADTEALIASLADAIHGKAATASE